MLRCLPVVVVMSAQLVAAFGSSSVVFLRRSSLKLDEPCGPEHIAALDMWSVKWTQQQSVFILQQSVSILQLSGFLLQLSGLMLCELLTSVPLCVFHFASGKTESFEKNTETLRTEQLAVHIRSTGL